MEYYFTVLWVQSPGMIQVSLVLCKFAKWQKALGFHWESIGKEAISSPWSCWQNLISCSWPDYRPVSCWLLAKAVPRLLFCCSSAQMVSYKFRGSFLNASKRKKCPSKMKIMIVHNIIMHILLPSPYFID